MKSSVARVKNLIEPAVNALGVQLWGVEHVSQGKFSLLRIYIDREEGVTIDDCEKVSRQVSALLDVEDPIAGDYTLEVSSPGIDRPLFTLEQFRQYVGEVVSIRTRGPIEGRRKFKGKITEVADEEVIVEVDGTSYRLPYVEIDKAVVASVN